MQPVQVAVGSSLLYRVAASDRRSDDAPLTYRRYPSCCSSHTIPHNNLGAMLNSLLARDRHAVNGAFQGPCSSMHRSQHTLACLSSQGFSDGQSALWGCHGTVDFPKSRTMWAWMPCDFMSRLIVCRRLCVGERYCSTSWQDKGTTRQAETRMFVKQRTRRRKLSNRAPCLWPWAGLAGCCAYFRVKR